ncbi:MAG: hypothetical protein ACT6WE_28000, partial [Shinella sp.]|uniref:hypothetical protein n=1 Tax=Shinella sp. TaxID=1870904 RepID=UPI004035D0E9
RDRAIGGLEGEAEIFCRNNGIGDGHAGHLSAPRTARFSADCMSLLGIAISIVCSITLGTEFFRGMER